MLGGAFTQTSSHMPREYPESRPPGEQKRVPGRGWRKPAWIPTGAPPTMVNRAAAMSAAAMLIDGGVGVQGIKMVLRFLVFHVLESFPFYRLRKLLIAADTIWLMVNTMPVVKDEAIKMIENLPDNSSWDDIIYEMYVKKKVSLGLVAANSGEVISHEDVVKRFGK